MMYLNSLERFIVFKCSSKTPSDPPKSRDGAKESQSNHFLYSIHIFLSFHFSMAPSLIEIENLNGRSGCIAYRGAVVRSQSTTVEEVRKKKEEIILIKH